MKLEVAVYSIMMAIAAFFGGNLMHGSPHVNFTWLNFPWASQVLLVAGCIFFAATIWAAHNGQNEALGVKEEYSGVPIEDNNPPFSFANPIVRDADFVYFMKRGKIYKMRLEKLDHSAFFIIPPLQQEMEFGNRRTDTGNFLTLRPFRVSGTLVENERQTIIQPEQSSMRKVRIDTRWNPIDLK